MSSKSPSNEFGQSTPFEFETVSVTAFGDTDAPRDSVFSKVNTEKWEEQPQISSGRTVKTIGLDSLSQNKPFTANDMQAHTRGIHI